MPYTESHTYSVTVSLPKGVTISTGVPGVNGAYDITISSTADTAAGASQTLLDGLAALMASLVADGVDVTSVAVPVPQPVPVVTPPVVVAATPTPDPNAPPVLVAQPAP